MHQTAVKITTAKKSRHDVMNLEGYKKVPEEAGAADVVAAKEKC